MAVGSVSMPVTLLAAENEPIFTGHAEWRISVVQARRGRCTRRRFLTADSHFTQQDAEAPTAVRHHQPAGCGVGQSRGARE